MAHYLPWSTTSTHRSEYAVPETWTVEQAADKVGEGDATVRAALESKIADGKGLAIYENHDLGHPMLGHAMAFTYGALTAQFEGGVDSLPEHCPDGLAKHITGGINWRYVLVAVVPPKAADDATV
jgi:hypothetical protein